MRPSPLQLLATRRDDNDRGTANREGDAEGRAEKRRAVASPSTSQLQRLIDEDQQRKAKQRRITADPPSLLHDEQRPLRSPLHPSASSPSSTSASLSSSSFAASSSWLCPSLVVRVLSRSLLDGSVYRHKAGIVAVSADGCVATLSMLSTAQSPTSPPSPPVIVQCPRQDLETVIPALGQPVLLVRGAHKGQRATLLRLSDDQSTCSVRVEGEGHLLEGVALEDVCKLTLATVP